MHLSSKFILYFFPISIGFYEFPFFKEILESFDKLYPFYLNWFNNPEYFVSIDFIFFE